MHEPNEAIQSMGVYALGVYVRGYMSGGRCPRGYVSRGICLGVRFQDFFPCHQGDSRHDSLYEVLGFPKNGKGAEVFFEGMVTRLMITKTIQIVS